MYLSYRDHHPLTPRSTHIPLNMVYLFSNNGVPYSISEIQNLKIETWKTEDKNFIETRALKILTEEIMESNLLTVIGNPGTGKTYLIHHVALQLQSMNYEILPVHFPVDIINYNNTENSQVFVIDDVCGKYSVATQLLESWQMLKEDIENILRTFDTKILLSCRTNIFRSPGFQRIKMLTSNVCDLSSADLKLSPEEHCKLASAYLSESEAAVVKDLTLSVQYDFFPLLCKMYPENRKHKVDEFFSRPIKAMEENLKNFQTQDNKTVYFSLALLVVFNNNIKDGWFVSMLSDEDKNLLQTLCEDCEMNCLPSRKAMKRNLDSMIGSYIIKSETTYRALHDKIFDILAFFFGSELFDFTLQHSDKHFVSERYIFESSLEMQDNDCSIHVPVDREVDYFQRIVQDIDTAFDNSQLTSVSYREQFIAYCCQNKQYVINALRQLGETHNPLVRMVSCGYQDVVEMLLDFEVNVNVQDNIGRSLVNISVENDYTGILHKLLTAKADPNLPDQQGFTPLCVAAGMGKVHQCQMLLSSGADPDKCSFASMFPLYWATLNGFPEIVSILLDFKANPNLQNNNGWTPLYVACRNGNYEIANLLLNSNADPNILQTNYGVSPILEAISRGHKDIVELLLNHHADYNQLIRGHYGLNEAVEMGHIEIAHILLKHGSSPDGCDNDDNFPLLIAASVGNFELAKLLLRFKADVNKISKNLHSPLSVASYFGRFELVKFLLENNADPKYVNENGETPLHIAVRSTNSTVIKLLLNHHSDPNLRNNNGNTCLSEAAFYGRDESVQILLQFGADPNLCNELDELPVFRAARAGHRKVLEILLRHNIDCNKCDIEGNTPLSEASFYGHYDCVLLLLENDADPNIANEIGTTALHRCAGSGHNEIVELLLNYNAIPYIYNEVGLSPKDIASLCEHHDIFEIFTYYESL